MRDKTSLNIWHHVVGAKQNRHLSPHSFNHSDKLAEEFILLEYAI